MKNFVLDASVIIKWIFPDRVAEQHVDLAMLVLQDLKLGNIKVQQPPHYLAEVLAVCTRLDASVATSIIGVLQRFNLPIIQNNDLYLRAVGLAHKLNHHLFDTLYHALALETAGSMFLTADEKYYHKAKKVGAIGMLGDYMSI